MKAECLGNKGRFLAAIERDILAMCEERSWVMPAHDSGLTNFNGTRLHVDLDWIKFVPAGSGGSVP